MSVGTRRTPGAANAEGPNIDQAGRHPHGTAEVNLDALTEVDLRAAADAFVEQHGIGFSKLVATCLLCAIDLAEHAEWVRC